jgi:uncharacterized lipoprotein YehR (DUF1307 family)
MCEFINRIKNKIWGMKNKFLLVVVTLLLIFSVVGCSDEGTQD